jgi:hypothetical protein
MKHIKARYFFVCHYHNAGEIDLRYCPTEKMWADVLTKPMQGQQFRLFRALLMTFPVDYSEEPPFYPSPSPMLAPSPSFPFNSSRHQITNSVSYSCSFTNEISSQGDRSVIAGVC